MKRINNLLFILFLLGSLLSPTDAIARNVDQREAFAALKKTFTGKDVDYYALAPVFQQSADLWLFFVDAEPMKGWEHDCYLFTFPKTISDNAISITPAQQQKLRAPPTAGLIPYEVKNRYGAKATAKPAVMKVIPSVNEASAARRTYAIILSGGINSHANYERYWNDCSFIYQTLVNKYGVPRENVHPIMSDGSSTGADMITTSGKTVSQPLDLDGDGTDDIELSATKTNISNTLSNLSAKLNKDDHLFFFVIDHGGSTDNASSSYICLWNNAKLHDTELAEMLRPFTDKFVNVNVVLGQCNSGGFVDDLEQTGCVVATACKGNEPSYSCGDIPFDEFVYQWTSAVNEAKHDGTKVDSDSDGNGRVTMEEAFDYAKHHDRRIEHPRYVSTPLSVGEDLAFNHLVPSFDLYIKDNPEDTGKEPNLTTDKHWLSPSIWVRNQDDGISEHENPEYSSDHQMAFVYVRVHNRGKEKFNGQGKWVHLYWAQASTGLTTTVWKGREVYEDKHATGGTMEAAAISSIEPGESGIVKIRWALPNLLADYPEGNFHFCLLAKIMDTPYDDGYVDGKTYFDILGNNDHAQKNVTIISKNDLSNGFNVYVRNIESSTKAYTLELIPHTSSDAEFYSRAKVEMEMSSKIYSAWERGGFVSQDIEFTETNSNETGLHTVKFISPQSKLQRITLKGNEFDIVKLKFNFTSYASQSSTYSFDLVQKDENGNIIGGETFIVESPMLTRKPIQITKTPIGNGQFKLEVDNAGFDAIKWVNSLGETIGNGETVVVTPKAHDNCYSVVATTEEGDVATEKVSLDKENGIESVSLTGADNMEIILHTNAPANSKISIISLLDGSTKASRNMLEGSKSMSIETGNIPKGEYIVCYYINAEIADQVKVKID